MSFRFSPPLSGIRAAVGGLFGKNDGRKDKKVIDTDDDGTLLFKEDIIKFVTDELEARRTERLPIEQKWTLNANFLCGNQYCELNTYRQNIEQLEPVYDWLERETFNRIAPLIETRIANLKKINYRMTVKPRTNELDDYAKAEISTSILRHIQSTSDFDTKKNTMIAWNELCGNCFWLSWWDKDKGAECARYSESSEKNDKKQERVIYEGDLEYGLLTPYEVYPESIFKQRIDAQRSIIIEQVKTVDEVYDIYGIKAEGSDVDTFALTPLSSGGGFGYENTVCAIGHRTVSNAVKVITYFERRSRKYPDGRLIIIVGDDTLVYYGNLPYSKIPIEQVVCKEVPGQFFGKSVIEELIPLQRAYNGCINRIHEYIKRIALHGYYVEEGSIDIELYEEEGLAPGAFLTYRKGSNPPVQIPNSNLPSEIMTERYNLASDMEYVAGTSQLMVSGTAPSGVTSGTAIENLMEIDNTRLSLTGDHIRNSIKNLSRTWLEIFKQYANTKRVMRYVGTNNIGGSIVWSGEDINSFDIEYVTQNELELSEDVQKQRFFDAFNMGLFTDSDGRIPQRIKQQALEFMKIGSYSEIMNLNDLQIQAAQRENVFLEEGVLPKISQFDDNEIHFEEHMRYILQMRFQILKNKKPQYAQAFENHALMHKRLIEEEQQKNMIQPLQG